MAYEPPRRHSNRMQLHILKSCAGRGARSALQVVEDGADLGVGPGGGVRPRGKVRGRHGGQEVAVGFVDLGP
eukprot:4840770-Alexandrium_andersonii.AAC.1